MPAALRSVAATALVLLVLAGLAAAPAGASGGPTDPGSLQATGGSDPYTSQIAAALRERRGPAAVRRSSADTTPTDCLWTTGDFGQFLAHDDRATTRIGPDGTVDHLYAYVCHGTTTFYWAADANPAQLAQTALAMARSRVPRPDGVFSPDVTSGKVSAIVNAPLRFGVAQWEPVSSTAALPGAQATVTAEPTKLEFVPGDGHGPVDCARPTRATSETPCFYTYSDASNVAPNGRTWPAQLKVTWTVNWAATNGAGGALEPLITVANYAIRVGEIEAIEQPN